MGTRSGPWNQAVGDYNSTYAYDQNGNILTLTRSGKTGAGTFGSIDQLTYSYEANSSNRLAEVSDAISSTYLSGMEQFIDVSGPQDYVYDHNGNLTQDDNKGITAIQYNHLNKPTLVSAGSQEVEYIYDAVGTKLRQNLLDASSGNLLKVTAYTGPLVYEDPDGGSPGNLIINYATHEEGRIVRSGDDMVYEYFLRDHLGNVRVVIGDTDGDQVAEILQEDHYYPFGLKHSGPNSTVANPPNVLTYNGKELQDEAGIGWMDYGARMYDASIGRWNGVDAFAESFFSVSPFNYVLNNPVLFIDPDGNAPRYNYTTGHYDDPSTGERDIGADRAISETTNNGRDLSPATINDFMIFLENLKNPDGVGINIEVGLSAGISWASGAVKAGISFLKLNKGDEAGNWFSYVYLGYAFSIEGENPKNVLTPIANQPALQNSILNALNASADITASPFAATFMGDKNKINPQSWTGWFISSSLALRGNGGAIGASYFIGAGSSEMHASSALGNFGHGDPPGGNYDRWKGLSGDLSIGPKITPGVTITPKYASYYWLITAPSSMAKAHKALQKVPIQSGSGWRALINESKKNGRNQYIPWLPY